MPRLVVEPAHFSVHMEVYLLQRNDLVLHSRMTQAAWPYNSITLMSNVEGAIKEAQKAVYFIWHANANCRMQFFSSRALNRQLRKVQAGAERVKKA